MRRVITFLLCKFIFELCCNLFRALKRTDLPILEEGHPRLISEKKCFGDIYRKRLFTMINELPTVFDVVTGKKPVKEKPAVNSSGTKAKSATKVVSTVELLSIYLIMTRTVF